MKLIKAACLAAALLLPAVATAGTKTSCCPDPSCCPGCPLCPQAHGAK